MQTTIIRPARYRHYKNGIYTVLGVAALGGPKLAWLQWPNIRCDIYQIEEDPDIHIYGQAVDGKLWYRPILGTDDYGDRVLYYNDEGYWARTVESFFGTNKDGQFRFTEIFQ
jgi:hypothetical protein